MADNKEFISERTKNGQEYFHFIGIGGIGMSALALCLINRGFKISGSDIQSNPNIENLQRLGAQISIGHNAANLKEAKLVIASTAIKQDNPEIISAKENNIPIIHRSQLLEALMSGLGQEQKPVSIGVSGTHGKTTTSGMAGMIFEYAKLDPSIVVGGMIPALNTNSKFGSGRHIISELDESDGTIAIYKPTYTIITNLEKDHVDHYEDGLQQVLETFEGFISRLDENSKIIVNIDDSGVLKLLDAVKFENIITYSANESSKADFIAKNIVTNGFQTTFDACKNGEILGKVTLSIPGLHNVSNSLSAIAVALDCGIDFQTITESLKTFTGMKRRFQLIYDTNSIKVVDDYAHHPTEVLATLKSADELKSKGLVNRVIVIFQPHRYSRLHGLWEDFKTCFQFTDKVFITEVYPAGESPIEGFNAKDFCEETGFTYAQGSFDEVLEQVYPYIKEGDIVLGLGAGSITKLTAKIVDRLKNERY
ncbi:MAG: UDP-N-acetylmuramate--L-alanine ligase [Candidatus Gastranaerophilales bacterium]|nr:UDP-N-acetylmuramate--L-alanine ligase [Candidatus Gastranaerophilales bacterium]